MGKKVTALEHAKRDDDLLSYLFIDLALFLRRKDMSRKMQRSDFKVPNVDWESTLNLLDRVWIGEVDPQEAAQTLLRCEAIRKLLAQKRDAAHRQHLEAHIDRYLEMWLPDTGYEIFETQRYKSKKGKQRQSVGHPAAAAIPSGESSADVGGPVASGSQTSIAPTEPKKPNPPVLDLGVRALRAYEVGEHIRLFGSAVDITDEQDDEMRMDPSELKADFSVLFSATRNCFQLFMGPGRFVNHDCHNNVELVRKGRNLLFKVVRPIEIHDEILTYYGSEYFGEKNEACCCATCQVKGEGAFSSPSKKRKQQLAAAKAKGRTRSGRTYEVQDDSDGSSNTASANRSTRSTKRGRGRPLGAKAVQAKRAKIAAKKKAVGDDSEFEDDSDDSDSDPNPKTMKRRRRRASTSSLSSLSASESDLTDISDLDDSVDLHGVEVDAETGTAINPLTGATTALEPTSANTTLLAASIPVLDEGSATATPAEERTPSWSTASVLKSAADSINKMISIVSPKRQSLSASLPLSPRTETSDGMSSYQHDE